MFARLCLIVIGNCFILFLFMYVSDLGDLSCVLSFVCAVGENAISHWPRNIRSVALASMLQYVLLYFKVLLQ